MSTSANTKTYLLNGPGDWDSFEQSFIIKISAERIYELGRLSDATQFNTIRIAEPKRPEFSDYNASAGTATRSGETSAVRGVTNATSYTDLLPADQEAYKARMTIYKSDLDRYNKQADGIRNVLNWMIEKITPHYVETCSPAMNGSTEHDNISQFFLNLKAACGIDDALRRKQARKAYFEVLKEGTHRKTNWEDWITSWEKAIRIAKLRGVAEAQHPNTWFEDLMQALEHQFAIFLRIEQSGNKRIIESGKYLPMTFSAQFRQEIQEVKRRPERGNANQVAKGSFGPTFQSSNPRASSGSTPQASTPEVKKRSRSGTSDSREGSAKRARPTTEGRALCKLCEKTHLRPNSSSCWVAFPDEAPAKFKPSRKHLDLFDERLEKDKEKQPSISRKAAAFLASSGEYPLRDSSILDSGTTLHIFNNAKRFISLESAQYGEGVYAGSTWLPILGYGEVQINVVNLQNELQPFTLSRVAYCPDIGTNLVSLGKLRQIGYWWDQKKQRNIIRHASGQPLCELTEKYDQYVLEHIPRTAERAAFVTNHLRYNSWTARKPNRARAAIWHRRLGHPGPRSLEHLVNHTFGAKIKGPTTVECDVCGLGKMKRQEHREPRERASKPGERVSIDFHDYPQGLNGYTSCAIITDRNSGMCWDYYFMSRYDENLLAMLQHFVQMLEIMYEVKLRTIETDNELQKGNLSKQWLLRKGIAIEESSPRTQQQNGSGERNLPIELWSELVRTAVYQLNRTPKQRLKWKTPYESFLSGVPTAKEKNQPRIGHMRVIGCKAFALTSSAQLKEKRLQSRTSPKAWIGFLVGYNSQNIFRVWNPLTNKIYITRDVIFNEEEFFSADETQMRETIGEYTLEEIQARLTALLSSEQLDQVMDPVQGPDEQDSTETSLETLIEDLPTEQVEPEEEQDFNSEKYTQLRFELLPTPPESPPSSFLAQIGIQTSHNLDKAKTSEKDLLVVNQAFNAGLMTVSIAKMEGKLISKAMRSRYICGRLKPKCEPQLTQTNLEPDRHKNHRRNLPPAPSSYGGLEGHRFEVEFKRAQEDHLESHKQMSSWTEISRSDPRIGSSQILDCKSFRTLLAIAARNDLELLQYDAVNAFVNAKLGSPIYIELPPGFRKGKKSQVLLLHKALYGLRIALLLWQTELGNTLRSLNCQPVPYEACCYLKEGIFIFFYVDDIVIAFKKSDEAKATQLVKSLQQKYKLTGGNDLQWFLGMEIIRDRKAKQIWVTQVMYLEKIYELRTSDSIYATPMSDEELFPNQERANKKTCNWYKKVIGSILYAAVISRPDIAFAISRLARFMNNPGVKHVKAANRVLNYLYDTRFYGLQLGTGERFEIYSDASFGDNTLNRKSSQGYAMQLFGSLVGWRANKQDTVTTSSTEAELLALAQAAKEGLFQQRLLQSLQVEAQNTELHLITDNLNTFRLLVNPIHKLKTKLRHVDIHTHWLREHIQKNTILIRHERSEDNVADGLTKSLQGAKYQSSCKLYGLVNIQQRIQDRRDKELKEKTIEEILDDLDM
ncbi:putative retrotransposon HobS hobase [Fusarium austroafricanum]|uniref:Putative retrotransposon HobS hobase n=1 Tax=Fusarium austroafricanum TaxID=2364996 RepID=A0A8H4JP07_9HYPO|nr:putative retrotransposon HobS hobase [Fusarium austroafricanum]